MRNRWQVVLSLVSAVIFISFASAALATNATLWTARYGDLSGGIDQAGAVTVDSAGNIYVTGYSLHSTNNNDYCTIKYDSAGNQLWMQKYDGPAHGDDQAKEIAVDSLGNVYVAGDSNNIVIGESNRDYCIIKYDSAGNQLWERRYGNPGYHDDYVTAMAMDSAGNIYVTGCSIGKAPFYDYCTIKYDSAGNQVWVQRYDGSVQGDDRATALVLDFSGNVYVTGYSTGSGTGCDYCTIKYDSAGNQLWVQKYNGPGSNSDCARAVVVDSSGNVYITGGSHNSFNNPDYCTIKYDSAGNQKWVQRYGTTNSHEEANAVAADSSGNVFITGYAFSTYYEYCTIKYDSEGNQEWAQRYKGPADGGQPRSVVLDSSGDVYITGSSYGTSADYCTIKYDSAGNQVWVQNYDGPGNGYDDAAAMAIDSSGNIVVTGRSTGSGTDYDYCTIKYGSAGDQKWVQRYNGLGNYNDLVTATTVDSAGNVFVTGYSYGTSASSDYCTIKYDSTGNQLWVRKYNGPGNVDDRPNAIAADSSGNVYVAGYSGGDFCTIKYNSAGDQLWMQSYNGPGNGGDSVTAIAVDSSGNVWVIGRSIGSGTSGDYCTIKYDTSGNQLWVQRYNGPANGDEYPYSLAVDSSGNAYVTGNSAGVTTSYDYCTIKYDSEGDQKWVRRYNGPANDYDRANAVAIDSSGYVYISGYSRGIGSNADYCTIKYDSAGNQKWVQRYNGPGNSSDCVNAMAMDSLGNIYVTGNTGSGTSTDCYTIKYDSSGNQLWARRYDGYRGGYDSAVAMAIDSAANIYITGVSNDDSTSYDYCTIKYSSEGFEQWVQRYNGPENSDDRAVCIAVSTSGNVCVAGYTGNAYYDYTTIAYSGADPTGSIVINGGAKYTASAVVFLNLSATIGGGAGIGNAIGYVRYSNDGINWTGWLTYTPTTPWVLAPGEGVKTVSVQFEDSIGNVSRVCSDSIILSGAATAKSQADSSSVVMSGVVTAVFGDSFYVEAADRYAGIRVDKAGHGLTAGISVQVSGTIFTDAMGERYIAAVDITPGGSASASPIALTGRSLGGGNYNFDLSTGAGQRGVVNGLGLNNIGLLVKISGEVSYVGSDFFYVDDGNGIHDGSGYKGVKVICGDAVKPQEKQYVTVVGISSIMKTGDYYFRCLKMLPGSVIGKYN